jgi:protein-tyrosine phosphatase
VRLGIDSRFFTLHKLRAFRRKAKLKGGLLRTDPAVTGIMSAPNSVPVSPASSKRSRSKDSALSATYASLSAPTANTTANTPAVSTNSLLPPLNIAASANGDQPPDPTPYPVFLKQRPATLDTKWNDLEWAQMDRMRQGMVPTEDDQPPQWARCSGTLRAPEPIYEC